MTPLEILEAHMIKHGVRDYRTHCKCGWVTPNGEIGPMFHRAHIAQVLDQHMRERCYEAWREGVAVFDPDAVDIMEAVNPYRKEPTNGR